MQSEYDIMQVRPPALIHRERRLELPDADIGGISPGSMPMSRELYQEEVIIPPIKLAKKGVVNQEVLELFL